MRKKEDAEISCVLCADCIDITYYGGFGLWSVSRGGVIIAVKMMNSSLLVPVNCSIMNL